MAEQAEDGAADLVQLWEEHIRHEFSTRNTDETLKTMVEDAYVDHVPVLTGGSGQAENYESSTRPTSSRKCRRIWRWCPCPGPSAATSLSMRWSSNSPIASKWNWMLPGIPPTGRRVEVSLVVIVRFRDGKLAHEHIYWDQVSVLVQIGLLDSEKLPVSGAESARKVLDPAVPANSLIRRVIKEKAGR